MPRHDDISSILLIGAGQFLERYGTMRPEVHEALDRLEGNVSVDLRRSYEATEPTGPIGRPGAGTASSGRRARR